MLLKRMYDETLAQASYLVGCSARGEALVIDPNRDIEQYTRAAAAEGLQITHVTETHIHADFVSGSRALVERTGAALLLSDEGGDEWRYRFAAHDGATLLKNGDRFTVGNVRFDVVHTPGHTPEHLTFLVTDTSASDCPLGAFTGDFIFVGDVGRPDLLERAANVRGSMIDSARVLYQSIQRFKKFPDYLQLFPGHGAGSVCGKALGAVPMTSLGYERIVNWGLAVHDEAEFVRMVLAGQPEAPNYFAEMKRINREGPAIVGGSATPERLSYREITPLLERGAAVIDTRSAAAYADGFIPGTINIPLNRSFNSWMGWLMAYNRSFYLILDDPAASRVSEALRGLGLIGLDDIAGYWDASAVKEWTQHGGSLGVVAHISVHELAAQLVTGTRIVIDVRGQSEFDAGHLPDARNIPVGQLVNRLGEIPRQTPVAVHCQSGARAAIAVSILHQRGYANVAALEGGFAEWLAADLRVDRPTDTVAPTGSH